MACYVNPVPTFKLTQHLSPTDFRPAKATPRAQRKQAAGPAAPIRREDRLPANEDPYAPRAARTEAGILGCDGCGRERHAAEQCYFKRHTNWNTQHGTVKRNDSAIAKEIRLLANGYLRSLPPDGVQWLPDDKLWIRGEKLKAWKAKWASSTNRSHDAKSAQVNPPDQIRGKIFHLGVVRGGTDVYPVCPSHGLSLVRQDRD